MRVFCFALVCLLAISPKFAHAEVGVTDSEILLGTSANMSGPGFQRAKGTIDGAKLVFDRVNKEGGINGRKIKFVVTDDKYDPKLTHENVSKLINQDKVFALFGIFGAPTTNAIIPLVTQSKVPLIAPASGNDSLRKPVNEYIFNIRPSYTMEGDATVNYVTQNLKIKEIGMFYQDDALGTAGREAVVHSLDKHSLKPKVFASYKRAAESVEPSVALIMKDKPAAVAMWAVVDQATQFIKSATAKGYKPVYFGGASLLSDAFTKGLGADAAQNTVYVTLNYPLPSETNLKIVQEYLKDIKAAGIETEATHLEGYVNATVMVEGLKQAGKDLTRASLIKSLEKLNDFDAGGIKISFSATDHQGMKSARVAVYKNGKLEVAP